MGYEIGYDTNWKRDIGYGVPAICDHPGCGEEIDRGLGYVCGGDPHGGEYGCGLFFCEKHQSHEGRRGADRKVRYVQLCERCAKRSKKGPFEATPDTLEWVRHKLRDKSWAEWRKENPEATKALRRQVILRGRPRLINPQRPQA